MAKVELKQLIVDEELFKRVKKYKRTIYVLKDDISLQKNEKVEVINNKTSKKFKTKVVKNYKMDNIAKLKENLKRKSKYIYPKDLEINDEINVIEFKYNKKIFIKLLLVVLSISLIIFIMSSVGDVLKEANDKKVTNTLNELEKEKISYVFIEINPQLVLAMKDNIVQDVACLNDDCMSFYDEIDIKGKSITDSIDNLYNLSKEKGFNVKDGVKVKATEQLNIENKDYITIEYIDESTKNELLSNVKNNEDIKNNNKDYYTKLWDELKKDNDYGKIYTCNMNNEILECFIKEDMFVLDENDYTVVDLPFLMQKQNEVIRVLNKFSLKTEVEVLVPAVMEDMSVYINDIKFSCSIDGYCNPSPHIYDDSIDTSNLNIWGEFTLYDSEVGLNLLKPNEVLNNLLYEEEYYIHNDYYSYEATILVNKICDINISNCKNYEYTYCDLKRINETENSYQHEPINCKTIDSKTYQDYYDEYVVKSRGWGCLTLDEFGIKGESVCELEEYYGEENINNPTIIDYVRCKGADVNYKNCTSVSLTKEDFKEIEYSYPQDGKVYKYINGVSKVCELDRNTLKFKCKNYDN